MYIDERLWIVGRDGNGRDGDVREVARICAKQDAHDRVMRLQRVLGKLPVHLLLRKRNKSRALQLNHSGNKYATARPFPR